ncbi:RsiV family protein [Psychrobacter sp. AOP7-B1-25]|uniref:RsiV family protein n=1 Tax=Psychrobacter sp. AOP7-B1-25 TaxID=3457644 RepID=UPI00402BB6FF
MQTTTQTGDKSISADLFSIKISQIRSIAMLAGSLVLGAVSMSVNAGSLISSTEYLPYQLPSDIQEACGKRDNCPEIEVKYLKSSQSWIDETVNARIDNIVVNSQMTESAPIKGKSSEKEVTAALDSFVNSQFQDMPDGMSWGYNLMIAPDYLGHVDDFELFEISSYVYTGGAHGMPYSEYLVFDPSTKKQVMLDDMLISGKKTRFEALAYDAYKTWVKTVAEDVSSYEKNWPFTLSSNVTLTGTGISIRYQHYSIGPYAYGMPVLNIPYSKLDKVIKPHFIPE